MIFDLQMALFVICFGVCLLAPIRIALVAYIVLSNFDMVDAVHAQGDFGVLNIAKGIVLPAYFLFRLRYVPLGARATRAAIVWFGFVGYVALAAAWSPYPASAVKLVGHYIGHALILAAYYKAFKQGLLFNYFAPYAAALSISLGIVHSIFYSGFGEEAGRFTSFVTAQGFAALLVALTCLTIASQQLSLTVKVITVSALAISLVASGSRIWIFGLASSLLVSLLFSRIPRVVKIVIPLLAALSLIAVGVSRDAIFDLASRYSSESRVAAAIAASLGNDSHSDGLGTYRFREEITAEGLYRLRNSTLPDLIFGHGTSSGADVTASIHEAGNYRKVSDPNRMLHDEYLRVIYEWGLVGAGFWLFILGGLVSMAFRGRRDPERRALPLLVYLPAILVAFAGENILAGSGSATTVGLVLVIAQAGVVGLKRRPAAVQRTPRVHLTYSQLSRSPLY